MGRSIAFAMFAAALSLAAPLPRTPPASARSPCCPRSASRCNAEIEIVPLQAGEEEGAGRAPRRRATLSPPAGIELNPVLNSMRFSDRAPQQPPGPARHHHAAGERAVPRDAGRAAVDQRAPGARVHLPARPGRIQGTSRRSPPRRAKPAAAAPATKPEPAAPARRAASPSRPSRSPRPPRRWPPRRSARAAKPDRRSRSRRREARAERRSRSPSRKIEAQPLPARSRRSRGQPRPRRRRCTK